jgi:hypothetical protein
MLSKAQRAVFDCLPPPPVAPARWCRGSHRLGSQGNRCKRSSIAARRCAGCGWSGAKAPPERGPEVQHRWPCNNSHGMLNGLNTFSVLVLRRRNSSNRSIIQTESSPGIFSVKFAMQPARVAVLALWQAGMVGRCSVGTSQWRTRLFTGCDCFPKPLPASTHWFPPPPSPLGHAFAFARTGGV